MKLNFILINDQVQEFQLSQGIPKLTINSSILPFIFFVADIQRKRPSHRIVTSSERQRQNASAGWGGMRDLLSE